MSLPLRITFDGEDYTYTVLTKSIDKQTALIKISLDGREYGLAKNSRGEWDAAEAAGGGNEALIRAIARNVALRHRL